MTRPIWSLMTSLPIYAGVIRERQDNAEWHEACVVNLPSNVLPEVTTQ